MSELQEVAVAAAGAGALGILGRTLHWVRRDTRPIGWSLVWELPVAFGMGIIGKGVGDFFQLDGFPEYAVTIGVAYIGPRLIDWGLELLEQKVGKKPSGDQGKGG